MTDADNREVLEYDGAAGAIQRWYAFGLGPDAVLNQMNVPGTATRATMIPDLQGSIAGTLDSGSGALTKIGYLPFGENPSLTSGTYRYTGRRLDPETAGSTNEPSGLYYYRARHYSPTLGRFLQPDPIGYAGGNNLYAYVGNDPLNGIDPSGLLSFWGVARFIGGSAEAAIGVGFGTVTSWTGFGAVAGGAVALHGADVAQAAWRGTDTFTSQGLQATGLSQNTANAIDTGISGAAFIAAGSPVLPYSLFGPPIAGGGAGTSLLSAIARGFVVPGLRVGNESNAVLDALQTLTGTGTNAAAVGRTASYASRVLGYGLEADAAIQGGVIGQAQGAEAGGSQGAGK